MTDPEISMLAEKAVYLKQEGGYNCCQAVTAALAGETDVDPEILRQAAAGFAVGMGNLEATCGSLIGAGIIAGLKSGGKGSVRYSKQISEAFKEKCGGATICRELKGVDTGKVLCPCDMCVRNAVLAYCEVMGRK